jgi:HK97 family phage portal protein
LSTPPAKKPATTRKRVAKALPTPKPQVVSTQLAKAGYASGFGFLLGQSQEEDKRQELEVYKLCYKRSWAVNTCIDKIAHACSKRWMVEGVDGDLPDNQREIVEGFLSNPNDKDTFDSLLRRIVTSVLVYGFVVCVVESDAQPGQLAKAMATTFDRLGTPEVLEPFSQELQDLVGEQLSPLAVPKSITVLPSWQMTFKVDKATGAVTEYIRDREGAKTLYAPDQVLHIVHPNSEEDDCTGHSVITPIAQMANIDALIDRRTAAILADDTSIDGIFTVPDCDEESMRNFHAGIASQYRDNGNEAGASRFVTVNEGTTYADISKSKEGQYLKQKQWARDQIALSLGVPLSVLGVSEGTSMNGAGSDNHLRNFIENTVRPLAVYVEAQINKNLISRFNQVGINALVKLNLEDADDQNALEQTWNLAVGNGTMTRNEVRELRHMESLGPDGDVPSVTIGAAVVPLAQIAEPPPPPPAPPVMPTEPIEAAVAKAREAIRELRKAL